FSVIFTLIKAITHFVPGIKIEGPIALTAIIFISVCFGLKKVWKPAKIEVKIANSNTVIEVLFGDLFEQSGIRAIAVNEFFDSKIGKPVSDKSLHGMFLQKCFGGHPEPFDKQVDEQLKNIQSSEVEKIDGKTKLFPIGTTALVNVNQDRYLVFALSKTDPNTCKAYSNVSMMWDALHELWQRARIESGGHDLNLPLVGSGLSGLGLPILDLLNLIILSAITETKSKEITQRIRVVLHRDRFDDLDLRDLKKHWEEK
ncbi:MAG: macro domain-containing protein, partial [Methylobacter sp.]